MSKRGALRASVVGGNLVIKISVECLKAAYLRSDHAWQWVNSPKRPLRECIGDDRFIADPVDLIHIKKPSGFARDVVRELTAEAEDGSTLLTRMLDEACAEAVEQGSEYVEGP